MKQNNTDSEKAIAKMLAEMPVIPRKDFTDNVLAEIRAKDKKIEDLLKAQPLTAKSDFADRIIEACKSVPAKRQKNTIKFAPIFFATAAAAVIALITIPAAINTGSSSLKKSAQLESKIAMALAEDPELYALAQADAEDEMSLEEFIKASEVLTSINPTTIEILAYNE